MNPELDQKGPDVVTETADVQAQDMEIAIGGLRMNAARAMHFLDHTLEPGEGESGLDD